MVFRGATLCQHIILQQPVTQAHLPAISYLYPSFQDYHIIAARAMNHINDKAPAQTITALDIRDQLKERWGSEFSRIRRLINGLNSEAYISSDALVSETAQSHRAAGQILQRLETFLQQNDEGPE